MMYNSKLVASLKANGKILREFKDNAYIPFGSEYSILIKNLNTVRAVVNIYIDGKDMAPGGLVISPGQEIDLERSIQNGNLSEGNKFKFIERTSAIEEYRGAKLEDGIVRIEYQFEKVYQRQDGIMWKAGNELCKTVYHTNSTGPDSIILRSPSATDTTWTTTTLCSTNTYSASVNTVMNVSASTSTVPSINDVGITVPGSKSDQKFQSASWFPTLPEKHSIVLRLLGETPENQMVLKPITTKHKPKCVTCGKQNKGTAKFCSECGTALEIFS